MSRTQGMIPYYVIITGCSTVFWCRQLQNVCIIFRENYPAISRDEMENILQHTHSVGCCVKEIWEKIFRDIKV
jgi:hypothetical protein